MGAVCWIFESGCWRHFVDTSLTLQQITPQVDKLQEAIQAAYEKNVTCYNISRSESMSGPAPDLNLSVTNKVLGCWFGLHDPSHDALSFFINDDASEILIIALNMRWSALIVYMIIV